MQQTQSALNAQARNSGRGCEEEEANAMLLVSDAAQEEEEREGQWSNSS